MTLRRAGPEDARSLAALHAEVFPQTPWDMAFWQRAIQSDFDLVFLIGEPLRGFAALRLLGPEAEVLTLGTTTRGRGDGAALLGAMMASATAAGARCLFLEVSTTNKAARALYSKGGFTEAGRRRAYYQDGSDALILRRDLPKGE